LKAGRDQDEERLKALRDAPLASLEAFLKARETDNGKWGDKIEEELASLNPMLLQGALGALTGAMSLRGEAKADLLATAEQGASAAATTDPAGYMALDLRARARDGLGRKDEAYVDYRAGIAAFQKSPPSRSDLLVGYIAYRSALIARMGG